MLATHAAHRAVDAVELPVSKDLMETLPSKEALGFMSMGYTNLVADYYWLRAVSNFGSKRMHRHGFPNLPGLIERALNLDPYFAAAYFFAGTALTVQGQDYRAALRLLEQGTEMRPDDWRMPFLLGFNRYYFERDYAGAALAMARAAKIPGAPPVAGPLAIRLAAEAGDPESGLQMIDSLMRGVTDPKLLATYEERRVLVELELQLKWLRQAVERFRQSSGHAPKDMQALVAAGVLREIPTDPLGGRYYIDEEGNVQTTSEDKRLRLRDSGLESAP